MQGNSGINPYYETLSAHLHPALSVQLVCLHLLPNRNQSIAGPDLIGPVVLLQIILQKPAYRKNNESRRW